MAAPAVAAAGAATHTPLASASLYVGDLDPNVTEPQVRDRLEEMLSWLLRAGETQSHVFHPCLNFQR
jgi:hypothetical protein